MVKFFKNKDTNEVIMVKDNETLKSNEVELKANSTDAATEKHVPVININEKEVEVTVGSTLHPMTEVHHIAFIALITDKRALLKTLDPLGAPKASFTLQDGEKVLEAYEYCNLHGLWVKKAE